MATSQNGIDALLTCFICYCKATDPRICPSCSKICCADCILKWLTENRSNCPHCRSPLSVHSLVNGRFVTEISEVVEKLSAKSAPTDICEVHAAPLSYFCATCSKLICSDCAMFESVHKGHKFERLSSVYDRRAEELKAEGLVLEGRIAALKGTLARIDSNAEDVKKEKESIEADFESKLEQMTAKLDQELKAKFTALSEQKSAVIAKITALTSTQSEVNTLLSAPKSKFLSSYQRLLQSIRTQATQSLPLFTAVSADFDCDVKPRYNASTFILHDYARNRGATEVVYSETMQVQREVWRLKIYPNGNGPAKGTHLSVFLELIKGGCGSITYDYRIELINQRDPALRLVREFSSDFGTGECWGYNRFLPLEKLLSEGYVDPAEDRLTFRFYVRPASYTDLCRRQSLYIATLEQENAELVARQRELRARLNTQEPLLVSSENPVTSPQPQKSSERLSWRLGDCDLQPNEEVGLLVQGYMLSPEEVSSSSEGDNPPAWGDEEENDGGLPGNDRSLWLEKRFRGLMESPKSEG